MIARTGWQWVKKTDKSMKPRKNVERQEKLTIYEFSSEGTI